MAIFCGYKSWDLVKEMFFFWHVSALQNSLQKNINAFVREPYKFSLKNLFFHRNIVKKMSTSRDLWQAYMTYVYTYLKPHNYTGIIKKSSWIFHVFFVICILIHFLNIKS